MNTKKYHINTKAEVNPVQNNKSELHIPIFRQIILIIQRKFEKK